MTSRSRLVHHIVLVLAAVGVLGVAWWVGSRLIEPVPPAPVPPSKASVSFDPRVDVRTKPLFNTLQTLFRGELDPGIVGRLNPFVGTEGGLEAIQEGANALGTIEEISLGGAKIISVTKGAERGVIALLRLPGAARAYEVRRLMAEETAQGLGSWSLEANGATFEPIAAQEDRSGKVWLVSANGHIGSIQADGKPLWGSVPLTGIRSNIGTDEALFALDGAGRLWLTDGDSVFVGNGVGFERIDLSAQLSGANRQSISAPAEGEIPLALRQPRRIEMLNDGRVAVITDRFVALFPLNLQGGADVIIAQGTAIVMEPVTGALWSVMRGGNGAVGQWVRTLGTATQSNSNLVVLPKQAGLTPALAAEDTGILYALDYAPAGSVLWSIRDGGWVANVVAPQGTQPQDQAVRLVPDRNGAVWAVLSQRGLLLARPSN
jgi:hypothetical protein